MNTHLKHIKLYRILFSLIFLLFSCKDYLDLKPDMKLATPETAKDLQAILDNISRINELEPGLSEIASDNFFLPYANWQAIIEIQNRESYLWINNPVADLYWVYMYRKIYDVNMVLDYLDKVVYQNEHQKISIYANAKFVRGVAYQKLAEIFTVPYLYSETQNGKLGLVLKINSDINEVLQRSSLEETHAQIKNDLVESANFLSDTPEPFPTRPSKMSSYAALARYLLSIGDYENAGNYANLSLKLKSDLLNYNNVVITPYPFELYNTEILYYSRSNPYRNLNEANARVDTNLYALYDNLDLRKQIFFKKQLDGYHSFVGDYSKSNVEKFTGLTTAEMYLIRAECSTRKGKFEEARNDLKALLKNRYVRTANIDALIADIDDQDLLNYILLERRKELIGRGTRWTDIRRLSETIDIVLKRNLNNEIFELKSEQIKSFSYLIPQKVIDLGGYDQN